MAFESITYLSAPKRRGQINGPSDSIKYYVKQAVDRGEMFITKEAQISLGKTNLNIFFCCVLLQHVSCHFMLFLWDCIVNYKFIIIAHYERAKRRLRRRRGVEVVNKGIKCFAVSGILLFRPC